MGDVEVFRNPTKTMGDPPEMSVFVGNFRKKRTDFVAEISDSTPMKLQKLGFQNG